MRREGRGRFCFTVLRNGGFYEGRKAEGAAFLPYGNEKIGQLIQVPGNMLNAEGQELGVRDELGIGEELLRNVGSTLNVVGAGQVRRVQEEYLKRSSAKIPLMFMADIIYGFRTVYPIPLALGCSFEPELLRRLCEATARESTAAGRR